MAASSDFSGKQLLTDIDDKVLLCAICMGRFKSPKILPCYHTFCEPCLTEWVKANNGQLICPTCKKLCPLPSEGVRALDRNRFIDDLLGVIGDVRPDRSDMAVCELCEKEAKHWCGDCGGHFFCNNCIQNHSKLTVLKDHKPMKIEEYIEKMSTQHFRIIQPRFCDTHSGNKLEFFCDTCQVPTCYKCTVVEHAITGHRMISLESALEKYMPEMKAHSEKVAQKITNLKLRMDRVNDVRKDLDANRSTADLQIKTFCQKLVDAITNLEIKLHGEVDDIYMPKMKQIDAETDLLEQRIASAESIHSYLNHLLTFGGVVDIMTAQKQMKNQEQPYDVPAHLPYGDIDSDLVFKENPDCLQIHLGVVEGKKKPEDNVSQPLQERERQREDNLALHRTTTSTFQRGGDCDIDDESDASSSGRTDSNDTADDVPITSTNRKGKKPGLRTEWSDKDIEGYRSGYPGKIDDVSMIDNFLFHRNAIESEPKGGLIDNIREYWWGDYDKLERHQGYIQW
ncbi:tripartite motif-containing protein 2-like [Ptychodera flava]|uniref:tripartite motif-containing protein 2-like n=1 Tax=Ptychodera flava TaxID=63121 RepID=UPI003969C97B